MATNIENALTRAGYQLAGLFAITLMLMLLSFSAAANCICKESSEEVGECTVTIEACGCVKKQEREYSAEAVHVPSGDSGEPPSQDNLKDAVEGSVNHMLSDNPHLVPTCFPD